MATSDILSVNPIRLTGLLACVVALFISGSVWAQSPPQLPPLNDPPSNQHLPGKFIWFDLATPNLSSQQGFYQDVFGWSYHTPAPSADDYVLVLNQGNAIAGMFNAQPASGEEDGATWISLMSVDNVDAAAKLAESNGGRTELAPVDVPARGRFALLRDPADALFGVIRSQTGDPVDSEVPVGGIIWVDLFAIDVPKMATFYSAFASPDMTVSEREVATGVNGKLLSAHDLPRAGIVPVDEEANRSAWVPYVRVADVEATLAKVVEGGGFSIVAPDPEILDGHLAVFVDPHGGVMGVVQWDYDGEVSP